ncbi:hypothetical protein BGW38_008623 [Lunasporangiospora selenospora]|uniref:RNase III domain-containing protein n=1 Tax=Lunasporangiospora selenospora TaxID=979761 RepID=A0A9P6G5Q4_9FUNG|nr:hypothetical protein BGW38_008623 [Lunasporangiospora selenospora]
MLDNTKTITMLQRVRVINPSCISRCIHSGVRTYATARPSAPPPQPTAEETAKVNSVYQRMGVDLSDAELMTQAVTHKSFAHGSVPTNERLTHLGRTFLEMHLAEKKWDTVKSTKTLRSSIAHVLKAEKMAKVARSMGVDEVMRWKSPSTTPGSKAGEETVLAQTLEAIVGAVYHDKGSKVAREFVSKHIYTY